MTLRRRYLQLRQSTLLIVIAELCACLAVPINRYCEQLAIAELEKANIFVTTASDAPEWAPRWLDKLCCYVVAVGADEVSGHGPGTFSGRTDRTTPLSRIELYFLIQSSKGETPQADAVTDGLMRHIGRFKYCKVLYLANAKITDEGLRHVRNLRYLQYLSADGTRITDESLPSLFCLKQLSHFDVRNTKVTRDGVKRLKDSLPGCNVVR